MKKYKCNSYNRCVRGLRCIAFFILHLSSLILLLALAHPSGVRADEPLNLEVHEMSFWLVDPTLKQANAKDQFANALPGLAGTLRGATGPAKSALAPLSLLTFHGDAVERIDVDLRAPTGRFLGHWPRGEEKSRRVRWLNVALSKDFDEKRRAYISGEHWLAQARQLESLEVRQNLRSERIIAYDVEVDLATPIVLSGGPDRYEARSSAPYELRDVCLCLPTPQGLRIGWVDEIPAAPAKGDAKSESGGKSGETKPEGPASETTSSYAPAAPAAVAPAAVVAPAGAVPAGAATVTVSGPNAPGQAKAEPEKKAEPAPPTGPPVEVTMSYPMKQGSAELAVQTIDAWKSRLGETGLTPGEIDLLVSHYAKSTFEPKEMVALFRLPSSAVDEKVSIEILPEPKKVVRVAWVLAMNVDPGLKNETSALVARLGHASYREREAAEKRLSELGKLAKAALDEALKSPDLEIVHRAERLLRRFKGPGDGTP